MSYLKKVFLTFYLSLIIFTSGPLFASTLEDFYKLEERYPVHFKGFSKTDLSLANKFRNFENFHQPDQELRPYFEQLKESLIRIGDPRWAPLLEELTYCIEDQNEQTVINYITSLAEASLLISKYDKIDELYHDGQKGSEIHRYFSYRTNMKKNYKQGRKRLEEVILSYKDLCKSKTPKYATEDPYQFDKEEILIDRFKKSSVESTPYYMLCDQPHEDTLGLFYLAWAYYRGIHPVPVTLYQDDKKIHGYKMTPWGKYCHDYSHSVNDQGRKNIQSFYNQINDHYSNLKFAYYQQNEDTRNLLELTFSEKKMASHFSQFVVAVYEAYQKSLVAILELSRKTMQVNEGTELPPLFKAFSASAFFHAHELYPELSKSFATDGLSKILADSVRREIELLEKIQKESEEIRNKFLGDYDTISTDSIIEDTVLSDEKLFEIIITHPSSRPRNMLIVSDMLGEYPQKRYEHEIKSYSILRKDSCYEIKVVLTNGNEDLYRIIDDHCQGLIQATNFNQNRQTLLPARSVLKSQYNFDIPPALKEKEFINRPKALEKSLENYAFKISIGQCYLMDFFLKTAQQLSMDTFEGGPTISEKFSEDYRRAFNELKAAMPPFVDDLQGFLSEAVEK